jgi:hypothetical protein
VHCTTSYLRLFNRAVEGPESSLTPCMYDEVQHSSLKNALGLGDIFYLLPADVI